jgi:hypothetical protein
LDGGGTSKGGEQPSRFDGGQRSRGKENFEVCRIGRVDGKFNCGNLGSSGSDKDTEFRLGIGQLSSGSGIKIDERESVEQTSSRLSSHSKVDVSNVGFHSDDSRLITRIEVGRQEVIQRTSRVGSDTSEDSVVGRTSNIG